MHYSSSEIQRSVSPPSLTCRRLKWALWWSHNSAALRTAAAYQQRATHACMSRSRLPRRMTEETVILDSCLQQAGPLNNGIRTVEEARGRACSPEHCKDQTRHCCLLIHLKLVAVVMLPCFASQPKDLSATDRGGGGRTQAVNEVVFRDDKHAAAVPTAHMVLELSLTYGALCHHDRSWCCQILPQGLPKSQFQTAEVSEHVHHVGSGCCNRVSLHRWLSSTH